MTVRVDGDGLVTESIGCDPVLTHGPLAAHDEFGAMSSCVLRYKGRVLMYYTGWTRLVSVPVCFTVGLAVADSAEGAFRRLSQGPVLGRDFDNPFLAGSAFVLEEDNGLAMWVVSCDRWQAGEGDPRHYYHIRRADSQDGIHWRTSPEPVIDFKSELEYAIARPSVLHDGDGWRMWYCYRASEQSADYLMGYAESADGREWTRRDDLAGIAPAGDGWESDSVCYPHVFRHGDKLFMLYNGNGYGTTGFGYAVAEFGE